MTKLRFLFALNLAMMFDATSGLAVYHVASRLEGRGVTLFGYMLGMFLALLPDLDVLWEWGKQGGVTGKHKTSFTHEPLVFALLIFLVLRAFSSFWAWTAMFCLVMHYLHDLFETGPGIPVFAPFADQRYLLCKWREGRFRFIYSLTPQELHKWLNTPMEEWLEWEYCHITSNSVLGPIALAATLTMMWLW